MKFAIVIAIVTLFCAPLQAQDDPINTVALSGTYYQTVEAGSGFMLITVELPPKGTIAKNTYVDVLIVKAKHLRAAESLNVGDGMQITGYLFNYSGKKQLLTVVKVEALSIQ